MMPRDTHQKCICTGSATTFFNGQQQSGATDENGHGTHVAGIAAAVGNNDLGVSGVAQVADLWACRFMDSTGNGYLSDATECIKWCTRYVVLISR